nr:hypothetical protein [Pantoea sp. JZ2]
MRDGVNLTEENCDRLHNLWLATGLRSRTWDSLEWGEEDEDGFTCVTGPDWVINNVGHYGG